MSVLEFLDAARAASTAQQPAPSWLPDPTERHRHRWWDGERWTVSVADDGRVGEDPVDLGQEAGPDWRGRWDTPEIRERRAEVLMTRYGVSRAELAGLAAEIGLLADPTKVPDRVRLLRMPREQVTGWDRNRQAVLLDGRNAELITRGEAVALVHCKRCGAVVELRYAGMGRYRCPGGHKFMLDDLTMSAPDDIPAWRTALAAQPARRGTRL